MTDNMTYKQIMVHEELKSKDGGFEQDWLMSKKIKTAALAIHKFYEQTTIMRAWE